MGLGALPGSDAAKMVAEKLRVPVLASLEQAAEAADARSAPRVRTQELHLRGTDLMALGQVTDPKKIPHELKARLGVEPLPLATPVVLPKIQPANVEEWVTVADTLHPQVTRTRVAYEVARLEIDKAKAGLLPTVDAVASVGANKASGESIIPGTTRSASVGVELNWPIYTGGAVQNRISETVALEQRSREEFENARRTVAQNTRVAYFGVQSGEALVKALEAAEASSRLSLEATQLGYKVGVRVNIDVLNAQTQLFQTRRDLFKSRYDVLVNSLRLRQASGQLTPYDLLAVNSLLSRP